MAQSIAPCGSSSRRLSMNWANVESRPKEREAKPPRLLYRRKALRQGATAGKAILPRQRLPSLLDRPVYSPSSNDVRIGRSR